MKFRSIVQLTRADRVFGYSGQAACTSKRLCHCTGLLRPPSAIFCSIPVHGLSFFESQRSSEVLT